MTRDEKYKAITERIGSNVFSEPEAVSFLLLTSHMWKLSKGGFIEAPYKVSPTGENVVAVCEEFDWEVSDAEIMEFCNEFIYPNQVLPMFNLLRRICDTKTLTNG